VADPELERRVYDRVADLQERARLGYIGSSGPFGDRELNQRVGAIMADWLQSPTHHHYQRVQERSPEGPWATPVAAAYCNWRVHSGVLETTPLHAYCARIVSEYAAIESVGVNTLEDMLVARFRRSNRSGTRGAVCLLPLSYPSSPLLSLFLCSHADTATLRPADLAMERALAQSIAFDPWFGGALNQALVAFKHNCPPAWAEQAAYLKWRVGLQRKKLAAGKAVHAVAVCMYVCVYVCLCVCVCAFVCVYLSVSLTHLCFLYQTRPMW
jgi:hypothetical protein